MRLLAPAVILLAAFATPILAQDDAPKEEKKPKVPPLRIEKVRVGFLRYEPDNITNSSPHYKPGMFAPVRVSAVTGEKPIQKAKLSLETADSEGERTITNQDLGQLEERKLLHFHNFVMPGNMAADVKVTIEADGRSFETDAGGIDGRLDLASQLILTLGSRIPDLRAALVRMSPRNLRNDVANEDDTWPRFPCYEDNFEALPENWIGYQAVDLMILTTKSDAFVKALAQPSGHSRLQAIAQWVRRGGRLIVSMSWENQEKVADLLQQPAWQPSLPIRLPAQRGDLGKNAPETLDLSGWAKDTFFNTVRDGAKTRAIPIAQLTPTDTRNPDWTVLADVSRDDKRPVMVRFSYGMGNIVLIGIALDEPPFSMWKGRQDFLKKLVAEFAPVPAKYNPDQQNFRGRGGWNDDGSAGNEDLVSRLHRELDNFDVKIVPFGWVALFILLYIIVVGPLDYLLLKYVFKRLEWTWITFPVVVFAVSFAAYFTAYAIKGKELRINQVDVFDFDLRTQLDEKQRPAKAHVYGQSFFTLLSPHIQNYTVGLEPNPGFWGQPAGKDPLSADSLSWLGKAETDYHGTGANARQSLFRRPYYFAEDAVGLRGVPIPVWTTKCFTATWEAPVPQMPLTVDLVYHPEGGDIVVSGKITNNLPVDLEDVWLCCYFGKSAEQTMPIKPLPGKKSVEQLVSIGVHDHERTFLEFADLADSVDQAQRTRSDKGEYNPTKLIKRILFYERVDSEHVVRNQRLRTLDQSWRFKADRPRGEGLRDAIIYARVKYRAGEGEDLYADADRPLPTRIWLGDLPARPGASRPALRGTLNHDTYIRVLVPVRFAGQ